MNERIKELKHQAFLWCDENIPDQYSHETGYGDAWEDKFAELIVRECIEQGKQVQSQNVFNGSKDYVDGREMGIEVFMNQIKKHFGVKE